jgi:hypothetical protein
LRVKIREEALVRNKAVHVALGVRAITPLLVAVKVEVMEPRKANPWQRAALDF